MMHELSLCENIRQILEAQATASNFKSVRRVRLEVGALSCVEPEAMRFGFAAAMSGSVAAGACLEIVETPGVAWCPACVKEVPVQERYGACPACGSQPLRLTRGDSLKILELEVE